MSYGQGGSDGLKKLRSKMSPTRSNGSKARVARSRSTSEVGSAPTLRVFSFLEAIAESRRPLSVSELSEALNVPQPTAHRIVRMLETENFLVREPGTRRFCPGDRLARLSLGLVSASIRAVPRRTILEELSKAVGETCNLGILVDKHVLYVDRVEAGWPLGLRFNPGSHVPLHCTSMGKLFLSALPLDERGILLKSITLHKYTDNTITDLDRLEVELETIRQRELALDNQEFLAGVVCVAAPIRGKGRDVIAAVAISAPMARMSVDRALEKAPLLKSAAEKIEATILIEQKGQAASKSRKRSG